MVARLRSPHQRPEALVGQARKTPGLQKIPRALLIGRIV